MLNDITGISKPLEKLIEEVSKSIGVLYEPTRIRRKTKAENDAELIKLEGEIERNELLKRAAHRIGHTEARRQANIDNTVASSVEHLSSSVSDLPVDPDWMSRYFEGCQDVSDESMQEVWAKVLAREISEPGHFSTLTLSILKNMTKKDAQLFERHASLAWSMDRYFFIPVDIDEAMPVSWWDRSLSHSQTLHMDTLGLLNVRDDLRAYVTVGGTFNYFDHVCYADRDSIGKMNIFSFSKVGEELMRICNRDYSDAYFEKSLEFMEKKLDVRFLSNLDEANF